MLYSIIVPVYNSELTLVELCHGVIATMAAQSLPIEIILVNDGSKDSSWAVIKSLVEQYSGTILGVNLAHNYGQHKALLCGLKLAKGDGCITIDDDLQYQPEDIPLLIAQHLATGADVVYGIYETKRHSSVRNLGSNVVGRLFGSFAHTPTRGSSFKYISRMVVEAIASYSSPYIYIDELLGWHSRGVAFVPISHHQRREGVSGYSLWKLIRYSLQIIFSYTVIPLRLITWFGLIAFLICLGLVGYFIYMKYQYGAELGFTALIVSLFMSTGLILFSIGVIGEYISRLFIISSNKPTYIIQEIVA